MYQKLINFLLESGYKKQMTKIGPVYTLEKENDNSIVFLTYHKDPAKQPVYLKEYEEEFQNMKEMLFLNETSKVLCIMIVDDGQLIEEQIWKSDQYTLWILDEKNGKLFMGKNADIEFAELYAVIEKKSQEFRAEEDTEEEIKYLEEIKSYLTPANLMIIVFNIVIFFFSKFFFVDLLIKGASEWSAILLDHEIYRLFTAMFLHADAEHLLSNLLVLFLVGSFVERYFGSFRYIIAYVVCGVIGNMTSFYFHIGSSSTILSVGASGAIYGVLGMLIVMLWKTKGNIDGVKGPGLILFVIAMVFQSYQTEGIDNWAHIGGFIAGIFAGIFLQKKEKYSEKTGRQ